MCKDIHWTIIYNRGKLETKLIVYIEETRLNYETVIYLNAILLLKHVFIGTLLGYSIKAIYIYIFSVIQV